MPAAPQAWGKHRRPSILPRAAISGSARPCRPGLVGGRVDHDVRERIARDAGYRTSSAISRVARPMASHAVLNAEDDRSDNVDLTVAPVTSNFIYTAPPIEGLASLATGWIRNRQSIFRSGSFQIKDLHQRIVIICALVFKISGFRQHHEAVGQTRVSRADACCLPRGSRRPRCRRWANATDVDGHVQHFATHDTHQLALRLAALEVQATQHVAGGYASGCPARTPG